MREYWTLLKQNWAYMLEPPWRGSEQGTEKANHWTAWLLFWSWSIAGLVLGAFVAPALIQYLGLANIPFQDALDIGVAVLAGFLTQFLGIALSEVGFLVAIPGTSLFDKTASAWPHLPWYLRFLLVVLLVVAIPLTVVAAVIATLGPFAAVGYALYRYFTWVGSGQARVTTAFVGALLVKTFVIPLSKSIITGALLLRLKKWLGIKPSVKE
jgi:hypothetical protein